MELTFGPRRGPSISRRHPPATLSLSVDKLSSGKRMEDRELHKRIDSRRYPTIEGVLKQIEPDGR